MLFGWQTRELNSPRGISWQVFGRLKRLNVVPGGPATSEAPQLTERQRQVEIGHDPCRQPSRCWWMTASSGPFDRIVWPEGEHIGGKERGGFHFIIPDPSKSGPSVCSQLRLLSWQATICMRHMQAELAGPQCVIEELVTG